MRHFYTVLKRPNKIFWINVSPTPVVKRYFRSVCVLDEKVIFLRTQFVFMIDLDGNFETTMIVVQICSSICGLQGIFAASHNSANVGKSQPISLELKALAHKTLQAAPFFKIALSRLR